jgi:hypothetical protein
MDVGGHDDARVLETALVPSGGQLGGGACLDSSLSFDVALANGGEGRETMAHLQAGSPHGKVLEDLIVELGGDDGDAVGRESRVGGQKAGSHTACHRGDD